MKLDARLLRSIRHTPLRQLVWRAGFIVKRNVLVLMGSRALERGRYALVPVSATPPLPSLPPRGGCRTPGDGRYIFDFLHRSIAFAAPIDWHRQELSTGTRLWNLHLHYFEYLETCTDAAVEALVRDWIEANRPHAKEYWLDSWNSYALSIRTVVWMQQYARRSPRLSPAFREAWKNSIAEQLDFLTWNLERDIGGNHLVKNIKALLWGGRFFTGPFGDRLGRLGRRLLRAELERQILPDGFHFELSPAYHCQVFADLLECWLLRLAPELREHLGSTLDAMARVIADMTHPDGRVALFNDGGLNMTYPPVVLLDLWNRSGGRVVSGGAHAFAYPSAGYFGFRSDRLYAVVDAGPVGPDGLPAHAHGDIFSFECSIGGERAIVDQGVFGYDAGDRRRQARSTLAHNTVTVDGLDQCEFWSSFRMGRRAHVQVEALEVRPSSLEVCAVHDGYARLDGRPLHRRRYRISPQGIRIDDEVTGVGMHAVVARMLLAPAVRVLGNTVHCVRCSVADRLFTVRSDGRIRVERAVWWPDFGAEEPSARLVLELGSGAGTWHHSVSLAGSDGSAVHVATASQR